MAESLQQKRDNKKRISIHGRRLFLMDDDQLGGVTGISHVVTNASSGSTGTNLPNHGVVTLPSASTHSFNLTAPNAGCQVQLIRSAATTSTITINFVSGTVISTNGIAGTTMSMGLVGDSITLRGISTSKYIVVQNNGVDVSS